MTKQVEVIASVQRRRRWPRADKERIVAAAMEPGAVASDVARAAGIHVSQLFRWRQQLCDRRAAPAFAAVTVAPQALPGGVIEVEFATARNEPVTDLIDAIDRSRPDGLNLSSAIRLFVLKFNQEKTKRDER
jgi:transposase